MRVSRLHATLWLVVAATGGARADAETLLYSDLKSVYSMWGFVTATAAQCARLTGDAGSYAAAAGAWRTANLPARADADAALAVSGGAASLVTDGEAAGAQFAEDGLADAADKQAACRSWLTDIGGGDLDVEAYFPQQLRRIREGGGG